MFKNIAFSCVVAALFQGCGPGIDCVVNGDNVKGHVGFGTAVSINESAPLVVQWSNDSFAASNNSSTIDNRHGLVSVPYSFCLDQGSYQFRAFQDLNSNGTLDAGEPSGRYDGTNDGSSGFVTKTITKYSSGDYTEFDGIDYLIDTP